MANYSLEELMSPELKELRRRIGFQRRNHSKRALSPEIRQDLLAYIQSRLDQDDSLTKIAHDLGISYTYAKGLLYEFDEPHDPDAAFLPVEVTPASATAAPEPLLEILSPTGFRLQGLTFQQALQAMKVLS